MCLARLLARPVQVGMIVRTPIGEICHDDQVVLACRQELLVVLLDVLVSLLPWLHKLAAQVGFSYNSPKAKLHTRNANFSPCHMC